MNALSFLRALLWIAPLIILSTAVHGSINLIVALWDSEGSTQLKVARAWARSLLRIAGVDLTIEGLEKVKPGESYIFASNHVSYMDTPVVLGHIPANFRFMAKSELFKVPFIGGHLEKAGHIAVPLDDARASVKVLSAAGKMLKGRGLSVLVFPEGGRSESGELEPFKEGAAYLAIKAGAPVIPVAIVGIRDVLPMHSMHVRPGRVTLRIGDPIETSSLTVKDRDSLTREIYSKISALRSGQSSVHSMEST
jgi:1-acyl-sn-glycerol-3-phosphate acyltransferase